MEKLQSAKPLESGTWHAMVWALHRAFFRMGIIKATERTRDLKTPFEYQRPALPSNQSNFKI